MAERHIQTVKKMAKKIIEEKKDAQMALLQYRNTPTFGERSPAELLMSRKLRDNLPNVKNKFLPKIVPDNVKNLINKEQNKQAEYYNRKGAKNLPEIPNDSNVYAQLQPKSLWQPAKVINKTGDRRYSIQTETGRILTRNRRSLKPFKNIEVNKKPCPPPLIHTSDKTTYFIPMDHDTDPQTHTNTDETNADQSIIILDSPPRNGTSNEADETMSEAEQMPTAIITQSGRESKPPNRLQIE